MSTKKQKLDPFTGLRALACSSVILSHCSNENRPVDITLSYSGQQAVAFFFVLSAFILTKNIMGEIETVKNRPPKLFMGQGLLKFFLRRFLRLYPPFMVSVLFYHYLNPPHTWADVVFFKYTFRHFWYMKVELILSLLMLPMWFIFYSALMIGLSKIMSSTNYQRANLAFHAFTCSLPFIISYYRWKLSFYWDPLDDYWPQKVIFFYGYSSGILSFLINKYDLTPKIDTDLSRYALNIAIYLSLIGIYFNNPGTLWNVFHIGNGQRPDDHSWFIDVLKYMSVYALFVFLVDLAPEKSHFYQFLNLKYIYLFGKASYSIYLVHGVPLDVLRDHGKLIGVHLLTYTFLFSVVMGTLFYNLVEHPCIKLAQILVPPILKYYKMIADNIKSRFNKNPRYSVQVNLNET